MDITSRSMRLFGSCAAAANAHKNPQIMINLEDSTCSFHRAKHRATKEMDSYPLWLNTIAGEVGKGRDDPAAPG